MCGQEVQLECLRNAALQRSQSFALILTHDWLTLLIHQRLSFFRGKIVEWGELFSPFLKCSCEKNTYGIMRNTSSHYWLTVNNIVKILFSLVIGRCFLFPSAEIADLNLT